MSALNAWLTAPDPRRGVRFLGTDAAADDDWELVSYPDLASAARRVGAAMRSAGVRPGDVVCLLMRTEPQCLTALFGALAIGATISPLVPSSFEGDEQYVDYVAAILRQAQPALVVTAEEFVPVASRAMRRADRPGSPWVPEEAPDEAAVLAPAEIPLLQFTSGSTGTPRGVRVSAANLAANFAVQRRLFRWRDGGGVASWLPLHHDMGLISCCLQPITAQGDLWLMRPEQFIRDPARWLGCFTPGRASMSAAPSFAFAYAARRVSAHRLDELDLSEWRGVCVGAEVIDAAALDTFARAAARTGFRHDVFVPSYGLAENTLAVSGGTQARALLVRPDWTSMRFGEAVPVQQVLRLGDEPIERGAGWLAGHGMPAAAEDIGVLIVDDAGTPLPDGHLGEILVTGSSVALGYRGDRSGTSTRFVDGRLHTGDAGFVHDGELFVLGRMGDSVKLHGRSVYVEDLDARVAAAGALEVRQVAVVAHNEHGQVGLAVFVEAKPGAWVEKVTELLRAELGPDAALTLVSGRRGLIKRTTSGKIRRRHLWQSLRDGRLPATEIVRVPPG